MIIENSSKAIIIRDSKILLLKNRDQYGIGEWYCLPGGRQKSGESIVSALQRECIEEISVKPEVLALKFIREYIHSNHKFSEIGNKVHKVEFMFLCNIDKNSIPQIGISPDKSQESIEWVNLSKVKNLNIFPSKLNEIEELLNLRGPIYWGDIL